EGGDLRANFLPPPWHASLATQVPGLPGFGAREGTCVPVGKVYHPPGTQPHARHLGSAPPPLPLPCRCAAVVPPLHTSRLDPPPAQGQGTCCAAGGRALGLRPYPSIFD